MPIMKRAVVAFVVTALPARSFLSPPTALPSWPCQMESCSARCSWGVHFLRRRPRTLPATRCKEGSAGDAGDRGSRGAGFSSWAAETSSSCTSALYATASFGSGDWGNGGGIFGGGGGNNGTDGGTPTEGPMDEGCDSGGADINFSSSSFERSNSNSDGPFDVNFRAPFKPWVWLSALWGTYVAWLKRSPLLAKALTSGLLGISGDMGAQLFEFRQDGGSEKKGPFVKDVRRLLAVAIDSTLITAPALHCFYGLLEFLIPTAAGGFAPAAAHLLVDTFVFDPMFVASFFCVTGMLESRSLRGDILPALRREFWPAVRGSWAVSFFFWPLQFVTFRFLPLEFRVLSVNVCDIVWTSVLSYFSHKAPLEAARIDREVGKTASGMSSGKGGKRDRDAPRNSTPD